MGKVAFSYLPPSSGRRCPEGAKVGYRYALKGMCGVSRAPSPHSTFLTTNGKDFSLTLEMTIRESDVS